MGSEITEIFAYADTYDERKTVEDCTVVALRFENGAMGTTVHNWVTDLPVPSKSDLDIHGTGGAIRIDTWSALEFSNAHHTWVQKRENETICSKKKSANSSARSWKTATPVLRAKMAGAVWSVY